ncbi:LysR family transcriptional regulator [Roseovarius sp. 2305UL8-3]|uniref:LysR family transcriptional regulator n=1 Tax=Roseovarius conchicola TaxID=3121636 RepID=UPI0035291158
MNNPYRLLPPLGSLVGFEAAARLGGFAPAADELNVTQSAISHQIRTLEAHLGQPLFHRVGRGVELTDAGRDLQGTSQAALELIRQGVRRLEAYSKPGSVILHMPPKLAGPWYSAHLPALRRDLPQIEPWLHSAAGEVDLWEAEFDITLRPRPAQEEGERSVPFLRERRQPLCAPSMLNWFTSAPDEVPLIHDEEPEDWQAWFTLAGIERGAFAAGLNFSDPSLATDAAARGLGVCLGDPELAAERISQGALVRADDLALETDRILYLVALERNLERTSVRQLWDWLVAHAPAGRL